MNQEVYTDLAVEAHSLAVNKSGREIEGVSLEEGKTDNTKITRIEVLNEIGAAALGKKVGTYITIESQGLKGQNRLVHDEISEVLSHELQKLINFTDIRPASDIEPTIFVVGLGNWNATPDALGPRVLDGLMVTRHLYNQSPP
ncbi:MAG: GPR endopeptidase, partial [bacterium]